MSPADEVAAARGGVGEQGGADDGRHSGDTVQERSNRVPHPAQLPAIHPGSLFEAW